MEYVKILNEAIKELELSREELLHKYINDMNFDEMDYDLYGDQYNRIS